MKLSDQVVSLEIAKKLKSLGVKQKSFFYWKKIGDEFALSNVGSNILLKPDDIFGESLQYESGVESFSAFTVAELGELLPAYTNINGDQCKLDLYKYIILAGDVKYSAEYWVLHDHHYRLGAGFYEMNESEARGKMLIYLIENKIIEV